MCLVFHHVSLSSVSLTVTVGQTARWPRVLTIPTTAALGSRPPSLTWARMMRTMTNLTKTMTRTKPRPSFNLSIMHKFFQLPYPRIDQPHRSFYSSATHRFLHSVWERALKNTALMGWVVFILVFLSSGQAHHPRLSVLPAGNDSFQLKFRGVTLFPVAALLLDVIRSVLRDPLKPSPLAYSLACCWKMLCGSLCEVVLFCFWMIFFFVFECAGLIRILMIRRLMNRRTYKAGCYIFAPWRAGLWMWTLFRMLTWSFLAGFFCRKSSRVCSAPWRSEERYFFGGLWEVSLFVFCLFSFGFRTS